MQRAVSQGRGGVPKVVCIGSGLGNLVAWPAIAFGFRGVGFDILRSCTKKAGELYSTAVDVITKKHELLQKYKQSQLLAGQESLMGADGSVNEVRGEESIFSYTYYSHHHYHTTTPLHDTSYELTGGILYFTLLLDYFI